MLTTRLITWVVVGAFSCPLQRFECNRSGKEGLATVRTCLQSQSLVRPRTLGFFHGPIMASYVPPEVEMTCHLKKPDVPRSVRSDYLQLAISDRDHRWKLRNQELRP